MRANIFFWGLLIIIITPSIYFLYIEKISYSSGAFIAALLIIIIHFIKNKELIIDKYILIFSTLIFLISTYSMIIYNWFDLQRFFLSLILLLVLIISSYFFTQFSLIVDQKKIHKYINVFFYLSLCDFIILLIKKKFFFPNSTELLFFPEVSHFSLIFLPLLTFKILTFKKEFKKYFWIIISLMMAILIENLTLLIGTILISFVYSIKKTLFLILLPFITILLTIGIDNFDYFTDRIIFNENTNNSSVLVFLSGWERAYLNFFEFGFLGIGFNQFGFEGQIGTYQNRIIDLGLPDLNLYDAGSVAPKLISELGILGIILIFLYFFFFFRILIKVKLMRYKFNYLDTFYISIFIMFFVNLFIRGSGYFSPITFLFFSSIFYLRRFNFFNDYKFFKRKN